MNENVAIVMGATQESAFALGNIICGLNHYSPSLARNIFVYHDGFSENDINALKNLSSKCIFREYTASDFLQKCNVTNYVETKAFTRYTHMSFCRYEMFDLLTATLNWCARWCRKRPISI